MNPKFLSKFFTPPLTSVEREQLFSCFGLSTLKYDFLEICGPQVISSSRIVGLQREPLLLPLEAQQVPNTKSENPFAILHYLSPQLEAQEDASAKTLWSEVLPYPLNLLGVEKPKQVHIQVGPLDFQEQLEKLSDTFSKLEEKMGAQEVTCLSIQNGERSFTALAHYVRRKRIRIGTSADLSQLAGKIRRHELESDALENHFGTQAAFVAVDLEPEERGATPLVSLSRAIENAIGVDVTMPPGINPLFDKTPLL